MIFDGDRTKLGQYIRHMADLMGLQEWAINLMGGSPENPNFFASIERVHGRKWANFYITDEWATSNPETLRQTVVHELVHLYVDPAVKGTMNAVADQITPAVREVLTSVMDERVEFAVDGIAVAWAETLPLPLLDEEQEVA